ncbi:MAG: diacylglycerol kinase family protein [Candidatus Andersenbacteria bacterium]
MKEWHKSGSFGEALRYAWSGFSYVMRSEPNIRRHLYAGLLAFILAFILRVPVSHLLVLIVISAMVLALELLNTALELLQDFVHPEYHVSIKLTKDITAAAVLVVGAAALLVGVIIFIPPIIALLAGGA